MSNSPKISLVMSSFNRAPLLKQGLRSIIRYKPDFPFEIVVVNDGLSDDGTEEVCETFGMALNIKYVFAGQRNTTGLIKRCPAIPNNIAIRQATGDIVILTSPEIVHLNNALFLILQPLLQDKKALAIPYFMYFDDKGTYTKLLETQQKVDTRFLERHPGHVRMPFFMGIWKSEIEAIRGYDEDFTGYAGEDNDFVERLVDNGCYYSHTPAEIVHLYHGAHCTAVDQPENPAWVYNKKLWEERKGIIVRNVDRDWGVIESYKPMEKEFVVPINPISIEEVEKNKIPIDENKAFVEYVFTDICKNRKWSSKETLSGTGSELRATVNIRKEIPKVFKKYKIKRVLDVGCGDVNWMRTLFPGFEFYMGIDVVKDLVEQNTKNFGTDKILFRQAFLTDPRYDAIKKLQPYRFDVVVLNDVLVHLSFADIIIVLRKLRQAGIKYILTTHFPQCVENIDIKTGRWRPLNLNTYPFYYPGPIELISNMDEMVVNDPTGVKQERGVSKSLSLWKLQDTPLVNGVPKIAHLYWGKNPMSWLQTQTVTTFHKQNPDWEIRVYVPIQSAVESKGKYVPDYTGKDYFNIVEALSYVTIMPIDMRKYGIDPKLHNILQSDIFRYVMLYEVGGLWMDFDILWLRPFSDIYKVPSRGLIPTEEMSAFVCKCEEERTFHSIGVLLSTPKHPYYKSLIDKCFLILNNNKDRERLWHQNFGTDLIDRLYPTLEYTVRAFPDMVQIPYKTFYPYSIFDMKSLYKESQLQKINDPEVLCVHWFNGHRFSKEYLNKPNTRNTTCSMSQILALFEKGEL